MIAVLIKSTRVNANFTSTKTKMRIIRIRLRRIKYTAEAKDASFEEDQRRINSH